MLYFLFTFEFIGCALRSSRVAAHSRAVGRRRSEMDAVLKAVVEAIHASPTQAVLCLSGGASQVGLWDVFGQFLKDFSSRLSTSG